MPKYILFIPIFLTSCLIQLGGITDEYHHLTDRQKAYVHSLESFKGLSNGHVYQLNGPQLLDELKKHKRSLVYTFVNGCNSISCLALPSLKAYADDQGLSLFCIMTDFGGMEKSLNQNPSFPLYVIDHNYYDTRFMRKYVDQFEKDIGVTEFVNDNLGGIRIGSYYIYEKDSLVEIRKLPWE